MGALWSQDELERLGAGARTMSVEELANSLGRSTASIKAKCWKMGYSRQRSSLQFLLSYELDTMYWIGFILADGCIRNNSLVIELSVMDIEHLTKFAQLANCVVYTRTRDTNFTKNYNSCSVAVADENIITDLKLRYDIRDKKYHNPPLIENYRLTEKQMMSLLIGFIDGDGSITHYTSGTPRITIQTHESWLGNLKYFQHFLGSGAVSVNNRNHACFSIGSKETIQHLKRFTIEHNIPVLSRKWDKI